MAVINKDTQEKILQKFGINPDRPKITLEDVQAFSSKESILKMVKGIADYNRMLQERIVLINESLTAAIPFTRENLYLFCAYSGAGKTTVAANISYPLWKMKKKVLVISTEERAHDIILRIACLEKGYDFNLVKKGLMEKEKIAECIPIMSDIAQYVHVCDVEWQNGGTQKIELVKELLEAVKGGGYSCALIDYFQLIQYSINEPSRSRYDVLNDFRNWLNVYIKSCEIPVCLFAQLHSTGKRGEALDARLKECSNIIEPATVIIEIVPNQAESYTEFCIHKDRFGIAQGTKIVCPYDKGKFLKQVSVREQAERALDKLTQETSSDKNDK